MSFKEGKRNGVEEKWDKEGKLICRKNYKDNKLDGIQEELNSDGTVTRSLYKDGLKQTLKPVDLFAQTYPQETKKKKTLTQKKEQ